MLPVSPNETSSNNAKSATNNYDFKALEKDPFPGWNVIEDATFRDLHTADCNDTINGKCEDVNTLKECISICESSENCSYGYFVKTPKENVCVPLLRERDIFTPYYRLRSQEIYDLPKDVNFTFFASDKYDYPPRCSNVMFYMDYIRLKNIDTGKYVTISGNTKVDFVNMDPINLNLLPKLNVLNALNSYIPVRNGEKILIGIPHTSLVFKKSTSGLGFEWFMGQAGIYVANTEVEIRCLDKPVDDVLTYRDEFELFFDDRFVVFDDTLNQVVVTDEQTPKNSRWKIEPNLLVYYCKGNHECKSVPLNTITEWSANGHTALVNGIQTHRQPNCWGLCKSVKHKRVSVWFWLVVTIFVLLLIIAVYLLLK